jgi:ADP-L-glycero-D-manno-heptose 6-epimerase
MRKENFAETEPVDPRNPYAWTKYLFERHVNNIDPKKLNNIRIQGFRYFNVYGPGEDHKEGQASPHHTFTRQAKATGIIRLFENSENYKRDFVPVELVTDYHQRFFDVKESGVWNIGTGKPVSFEQVARNIAEQYGAKIDYIPMPAKLKDSYQTYTCADMSKTLTSLQNKGE